MQTTYKSLIFTNHALQRMNERGISQKQAWATWNSPDSSKYSKTKHAYIYIKNLNHNKIQLVAKKNNHNQWVVISVWSEEPVSKNKKQSNFFSFLKKIFT
jgi:hypothetical protein